MSELEISYCPDVPQSPRSLLGDILEEHDGIGGPVKDENKDGM
jgi:hypothetical protein